MWRGRAVAVGSEPEYRVELQVGYRLVLLLHRLGDGQTLFRNKNTDKLVAPLLRVFYFCE
jgi:hypothetical protein